VTRLITIFILIAGLYCGYRLYLYWEKIKTGEDMVTQETIPVQVKPENLPGMPEKLGPSFRAAQQQDPVALGKWLRTYGNMVQDPRRAWIELDYCAAIAREDPAEARRVFAGVKERTAPSSPVWPRVHQLEKSYE
jgi:hypothetical protein